MGQPWKARRLRPGWLASTASISSTNSRGSGTIPEQPFSLKYMTHATAKVLPDSYCELGAYISSMPAEAARDGNKELAAGEDIFMHGIPSNNLPACQFCHGPEGRVSGNSRASADSRTTI